MLSLSCELSTEDMNDKAEVLDGMSRPKSPTVARRTADSVYNLLTFDTENTAYVFCTLLRPDMFLSHLACARITRRMSATTRF